MTDIERAQAARELQKEVIITELRLTALEEVSSDLTRRLDQERLRLRAARADLAALSPPAEPATDTTPIAKETV